MWILWSLPLCIWRHLTMPRAERMKNASELRKQWVEALQLRYRAEQQEEWNEAAMYDQQADRIWAKYMSY